MKGDHFHGVILPPPLDRQKTQSRLYSPPFPTNSTAEDWVLLYYEEHPAIYRMLKGETYACNPNHQTCRRPKECS